MPRLALAQTHHADCWKKPHHHECALNHIEQLKYQYKLLVEERRAPQMAPTAQNQARSAQWPVLRITEDQQMENLIDELPDDNNRICDPMYIDLLSPTNGHALHTAGITVWNRDGVAERLVACWNACAGMETHTLYDGQLQNDCEAVRELLRDKATLVAERDELRAQLQALTHRANGYLPDDEYIVTEQGLWLEPLGSDVSVRVLFDDGLHIHVYRKGEEDGDEVDAAVLDLP